MMRTAMMLGTAAFAVADQANHPMNKWVPSAVNFTVYVNERMNKFDASVFEAGVFTHLQADATRVATTEFNYGMEVYNTEARLEQGINQAKFNARFYADATGLTEAKRIEAKAEVEKLAYAFYSESHEAHFDKFDEEYELFWEDKQHPYEMKVESCVRGGKTLVECQGKVEAPVLNMTGLRAQVPSIAYSEVDCHRTNVSYVNAANPLEALPEWAVEADFEEPTWHAECVADDEWSTMSVVGLYCAGYVALGSIAALFIMVTSQGEFTGKPAPAAEPQVA